MPVRLTPFTIYRIVLIRIVQISGATSFYLVLLLQEGLVMTEPVASSLSHSTTRQINTAGRTDCWIGLCLAALLGCALSVSATRADETVVVDFGVDCGPVTYRGSGFLHGMSTTEPPSAMLDPIKPRMFRSQVFNIYPRAAALGAEVQFILSDMWGYNHGSWPGDDGDWTAWEDLVASRIQQAQTAGYIFQWDIWNEANISIFWGRDAAQFFETWRRGYNVIRTLEPDATIVGPSLAAYHDPNTFFTVKEFLIYARDHDVLPDVLSWHEWHPQNLIPHVTDVRTFMAANGIAIDRISINETIFGTQQTWPGIIPWYFHAIEETGLDSAAHSCWNEPSGVWNCWTQTLGGLLTLDDRQPRATWWVYKAYGDMTGRLVPVTPSARVAGIACQDIVEGDAQILLGRASTTDHGLVSLDLGNLDLLPFLIDQDDRTRVLAERILDSEWEASSGPIIALDSLHAVAGGRVLLELPEFGLKDAYVVKLYHPLEGPFRIAKPDFDRDGDVDQEDFGHFQACLNRPGVAQDDPLCASARLDGDDDVDQDDFGIFQACMSGANQRVSWECPG